MQNLVHSFTTCSFSMFSNRSHETITKRELPLIIVQRLCRLFITGCNEVVAKVIFLHLSVIHSVHRGGGLSQCMLGYPPPPREQTPSPDQAPPGPDTPPGAHPPGSRLQHTVYERPVRILLECILVDFFSSRESPFQNLPCPCPWDVMSNFYNCKDYLQTKHLVMGIVFSAVSICERAQMSRASQGDGYSYKGHIISRPKWKSIFCLF